MDPAELQQLLRRLAQAHPGEHPYTLALRLQAETGKAITGQLAKQILQRLDYVGLWCDRKCQGGSGDD
jgi:hypothetical protein